jgi:ABC-type glycerol-3-phosphate transport system substrate-binding protein
MSLSTSLTRRGKALSGWSLIVVFLLTTGLQCKLLNSETKQLLEPITLTWWGVEDSAGDVGDLINAYRAMHNNITITYRQFRPEEFESELINALAEDRGPDILSIPNAAVAAYQSKLTPQPASITMAYEVTQKSLGIKEEKIIEVRKTPTLTPGQVKNLFVDVVAADAIVDDKLWGLPLSMDVLVQFYNRDLLNNAAIPLPPTTWNQLQANVTKLTFQNTESKLVQAGAALGTGKNVDHAFDILSLLMMQNGAEMTRGRSASFPSIPQGAADRGYNPGADAVSFYTDFATPTKDVYTWDETFPASIDAFAQGKVAIAFGYHRDIKRLEAKRQGKLSYGIAPIPQIEGRPETSYANYWLQTVSKKSPHPSEAWDFILFAASHADQARGYLTKTKKPTALRALVEEQLQDDALAPFAKGVLTAKNWYRGNDLAAARNAFVELIDAVRTGTSLQQAMTIAAQKISQTL